MKKPMEIIIVDTEYTAWEGSHQRGWSESWEQREIIQIAAAHVVINQSLSISSYFDVLVKPKVNPILSDYITQLTGISQLSVEERGLSFKEALREFKDYCESLPGIYCWGNDEVVVRENCAIHELCYEDYFAGFFDIRHVFKKSGINTRQYESGSVYKSVNLILEQSAHYALNDVKSMCETLRYLFNEQRLALPEFSACPRSQ